jgi:hypothetical protein
MWSYGFYVILSWCGAFPPETARDRSCFAVYTYSGSLVWWRATTRSAVKLGSFSCDSTTIRIPVTLSGTEQLEHRHVSAIAYIFTWLYIRPMTPPPEWCPFGSASAHQSARLPLLPLAQPPCAPHALEASCWARASTAVGAASMRTSHPRSVVLGACLYCRWRSLHAHLTPLKRRVGRVPLLPLAQPPCALGQGVTLDVARALQPCPARSQRALLDLA